MNRPNIIYKREPSHMSADEVCIAAGVSRDELQSAITAGHLPPPSSSIKPGALLWLRSEIEEWAGKRWMRRRAYC